MTSYYRNNFFLYKNINKHALTLLKHKFKLKIIWKLFQSEHHNKCLTDTKNARDGCKSINLSSTFVPLLWENLNLDITACACFIIRRWVASKFWSIFYSYLRALYNRSVVCSERYFESHIHRINSKYLQGEIRFQILFCLLSTCTIQHT